MNPLFVTQVNHARAQPLLDEWIQYHIKVFQGSIAIQYDLESRPFEILEKTYKNVQCIPWKFGPSQAQQHAFQGMPKGSKHRMIVLTLDDFLVVTDSFPEHLPTNVRLPRFFFKPCKRGSCIVQSTFRNSSPDTVPWPAQFVGPKEFQEDSLIVQTTLPFVPEMYVATYLRTPDLFYNYNAHEYTRQTNASFPFQDLTLQDNFVQ